MKVISLMENSSLSTEFSCAHGLSLYIETEDHRILFDVGPVGDLLLKNATLLDVNLAAVDTAILSHGHYDHVGGLLEFCRASRQSTIFLRREALGPYYSRDEKGYTYIGPAADALQAFEIRFRSWEGRIDRELTLFRNPPTQDYPTRAGESLVEKIGEDEYRPDPFTHEQNLIVETEGKKILFGGCAHRGIVNILRQAEELVGGELDWVVSGFHLMRPTAAGEQPEDAALIDAVGGELARRSKTRYITGHCTGQYAYERLSAILGERLTPMPTGSVFEL